MADGGALINLGDLSKPATVLIEKVASAIGVAFEPARIKRKARAEVEAEKIKALGQIELKEIEQRALERFLHQEARKQENIERITAQAAASLSHDAKTEDIEEDWIVNFFKNCDTVSDQEMQSLWARLLAGEATNPGSFSRRTVDFISTIDKRDAAAFTNFCQFVWMTGELTPLIFDLEDEIYKKAEINFSVLNHLDSIGLITYEAIGGFNRTGLGKRFIVFYFGRPMVIEFEKDSKNVLKTGHALLTSSGKELAAICGAQRNEEIEEYVARKWVEGGASVMSLY